MFFSGCSRPEEPAPVLKELQKKNSSPLPAASNVTGTMKINDEARTAEALSFKTQSRINISVDITFASPGITETSGIIKWVRIVNEKKIVGPSLAITLPAQDVPFELPKQSGDWELLILNSQNAVICTQKITLVE